MAHPEIDEGDEYIGYHDALAIVFANTYPIGVDTSGIESCTGHVLAEDVVALVSSPTNDISLKDGFAVRATDVAKASLYQPVRLRVLGSAFAGHSSEDTVSSGSAVKITSGSPVPSGADAIVSEELCYVNSTDEVYVMASAEKGQNIFPAGGDIKAGTTVAEKGAGSSAGSSGTHRRRWYKSGQGVP